MLAFAKVAVQQEMLGSHGIVVLPLSLSADHSCPPPCRNLSRLPEELPPVPLAKPHEPLLGHLRDLRLPARVGAS